MTRTLTQRAAALLVTTVLAAAWAWAQTTTGEANPGGMSQESPPGMMAAPSGTSHKAMPHANRSAMARQPGETTQNLVERRIADLHARLHITSQQGPQWDQFTQVMRDNAKDMDQAYQQRADKFASMSAVDNMQSYAQIEQQRAQDMQKLVPAFQSLYASLSDQQKTTADQMFRNFTAERVQAHRQAAAR